MQNRYSNPLTPRQQKEKNNQRVKVILRVRPFFENQDQQQYVLPSEVNTISVNKPGLVTFMKFNFVQHVIHEKQNVQCQKQMFQAVEETVTALFEGVDSTIFAQYFSPYRSGQTGAGKTYSIIGDCPENHSQFGFYKSTLQNNQRGILPRSLEIIFAEQKKKQNSRITISFFEIYNEKIFDLLSGSIKPLQIRESKQSEISIPDLVTIEVINIKEAINCLAQGIKNRATSSTSANIKSSRSHSIFQIKYEQLVHNQQIGEDEVLVSHLKVVDLAGSEKFNIPAELPSSQKQIRIKELKCINGSLSKLGHCISALSSTSRTHIPVRDCKLTRILSDALLGSSKIRLIVCVSPSVTSMNETSSTLQFADRVKKAVFDRPYLTTPLQRRKTVDLEQYNLVVQQLQQQRSKRQQLQKYLQFSNQVPDLTLLKQNEKLRKENNYLKQQLKVYMNHQKVNTSRIKQQKKPIYHYAPTSGRSNKSQSRSPFRNNSKNLATTVKYQPPKKMLSKRLLKQGNYVKNKTGNTPPKTAKSKSIDGQSKSIRHSIDNKKGKPNNKHLNFEKKIKMFMDKNEIDKDLEDKVNKRLKQIKKQIISSQEIIQDITYGNPGDTQRLWGYK